MCIAQIIAAFKPKPVPELPVPDPPAPVLTIPHPEEPQDITQSMDNTIISDVVSRWKREWNVPDDWQGTIVLSEAMPYPGWTIGDVISIRPSWANPGVIAHEVAHVVYALLTDAEKDLFVAAYADALATDPLVKLMAQQHSYALTSSIEGHAECYRYLGMSLPETLKRFYPGLFA